MQPTVKFDRQLVTVLVDEVVHVMLELTAPPAEPIQRPPVDVVVVLDRLELIQQTLGEFRRVGIGALKTAETKDDLRRMLRDDDTRGVIITTIFRFSEAGSFRPVMAPNS